MLAAINKVETNFGQNLGPSSAGAVGWMQFMPSTWARLLGVDANGDGVADPNNPTDAISAPPAVPRRLRRPVRHRPGRVLLQPRELVRERGSGLASLYSQGSGATGFAVSQKQLTAQLASARSHASASRSLLGSARAQAAKLARPSGSSFASPDTARVLSDQLAARKRAVLLGLRRQAADARVNQLRRRLSAATTQLGRYRSEENNASFGRERLRAPLE